MKTLKSLLDLSVLPEASEVIITTEGYGVWFSWEGEYNPHVTQIFQDYGGMPISEAEGQALWFFFSNDVLIALAKLSAWAKFNSMSSLLQVIPSILHIDVRKKAVLEIADEFKNQVFLDPPKGLYCLVPATLKKAGQSIPGLGFLDSDSYGEEALALFENLDISKWFKLTVDSKLPYSSPGGWYAIIHPLGSPFDKQFQMGWRSMFAMFETIIEKNKLKYSIHDNFLMVFIDHFSQLKTWTQDILESIFALKDSRSPDYWPCVNVIVDRKGLNYSNDLPQKLPLKWDRMSPDLTHMSYRNAYPLGPDFSVQDVYFTSGTSSIDNMCTVTMSARDLFATKVPILLPGQFVTGSDVPCFYCGIKSHTPHECPSRNMPEQSTDYWEKFNNLDIDSLNLAFRNIEMGVSREGVEAYSKFLQANELEARVLEAVFQTHSSIQLRAVERIWHLFDKNINAQVPQNFMQDDSPAWKMLSTLHTARLEELALFEKNVLHMVNEFPRDWKLKSLLGFISVHRGDYEKAFQYWRAAESSSSSILHQAWHFFLQARVLEILGKYQDAYELYDDAKKLLPDWREPIYRQYVCQVKLAKIDVILADLLEDIQAHPELFNRVILDPEFERGQLIILTALYPLWADSLKFATLEQDALHKLLEDLNNWFPNEHIVADSIRSKLQGLIKVISVQNFLACKNITRFRPLIEEDIEQLKKVEIAKIKKDYKGYLTNLEIIRDEASWFPFPRTLIDFNKDFNECASLLNWAFGANFNLPEPFNKALNSVDTITELLTRLKNKLKFIRTVRDSTLYGLIFLKTFIWFGAALLAIALMVTIVITLFGASIGLAWLQRLMAENFWDLQQTLLIVIGVFSLGVASLRATFLFEKRRDKMVADAKAAREEMQRKRLEHIKNMQF